MGAAPTPNEVKALRQRHGVSQVELAVILHVSDRTVQRWEKDDDTPMPLAAWELAKVKLGEIRARRYRSARHRKAARKKRADKVAASKAHERPRAADARPAVEPPTPKPSPLSTRAQRRSPDEMKALREMARASFGLKPRV